MRRPDSQVIAAVRTGTRDRAVDGSEAKPALVWAVVVLTLVAAWVGAYVAGGSKTVAPHAFYVPVLLTAVRFGAPQTIVVAVVAGVAAGPLMPQDVAAGVMQEPANWIMRLVIFALLGQMTAYFASNSLPTFRTERDHRRVRRDLAVALEDDQLRVVYQPIVRLASGEVAGIEALIRWKHPDKGPIPPDQFIPDAERAGCSGLITGFVVAETLRQVAEWRESALKDRADFKVAINVSAGELGDPELVVTLSDALASTGVPAEWVHLEVTETALIADVEHAADALMELRMLGLRLAIDDFGTGQSSLAQLHRFPVDVLKIDRFFLDPLGRHERGTVLANGVIALAHGMDLVTVVEGVETSEQAAVLRDLGCDLAQGYLFSPAQESDDIGRLLASGWAIPMPSPSRRSISH